MAVYKLSAIQQGMESAAGTLVPATFKHRGAGTLKFNDKVEMPGMQYATGFAGGTVEDTFISDTGSTLTLSDAEFSAEGMFWLGNQAIKSIASSASADSVSSFTFPTTAANTIKTFTWEMQTDAQEYEFGNAFCSKFSVHGDVNANNGRIMYNSIHEGRVAAASTFTSSLGFLANLHPLNMNYAGINIDAIGTLAGTASATTGVLKAFSVDVETGWTTANSRYADGRSTKDLSLATFGDYKISGTIKMLLSATAVTHIANARAGTPVILQWKCQGAGGRYVAFKLPVAYSDTPTLGTNTNGLILCDFPYQAAYSTTSTAQGPSIDVVGSAAFTLS